MILIPVWRHTLFELRFVVVETGKCKIEFVLGKCGRQKKAHILTYSLMVTIELEHEIRLP